MSSFVLIRHSKTEPGNQWGTDWPLSEEGRGFCQPLADALRRFNLDVLVSSRMARARETAELLATQLGIEWRIGDGLEEHRRPFLTDPTTFLPRIEALFANPARPVFGEPAHAALGRFRAGVEAVLAREPGRNVGVVTHGTVMTLYAAPLFDMRPQDLWRAIGHPCVVVLDRETGRGVEIVDRLPGGA